uniref:Peptidase S1 domain-containing protein n=1 Tax=Pelusios castaneus TaxID=367368 RepID=A0A8C8VIK0_9SAUR
MPRQGSGETFQCFLSNFHHQQIQVQNVDFHCRKFPGFPTKKKIPNLLQPDTGWVVPGGSLAPDHCCLLLDDIPMAAHEWHQEPSALIGGAVCEVPRAAGTDGATGEGERGSTDIRIVGGYPCEKGQPWQAALFYDQLYCGGVLMNKDWVLSAAHCRRVATVVLGEYNLRQPDESEQRKTAAKLIPHPNYNPSTKDNDIMLIKLTTPVQFNNNVYPIALARSTASPGTICLVSGWGTTTSPIRTCPSEKF